MPEAVLRIGEKEVSLPLMTGSVGETAVDISSLRDETGAVTLDDGFANTAETASDLTFVDGEAGVLIHRGYTIEDLASEASFLEVAHLLLFGALPTKGELESFVGSIQEHLHVDSAIRNVFSAVPQDAHPMQVLGSAVAALGGHYADDLDPNDPESVERNSYRLIAKLPILIAWAHRAREGQEIVDPIPGADYVANFLEMMFGDGGHIDEQEQIAAKALDSLLLLHADHGQNCSTSAVRLVGSSGANLYGAITGGIFALSGPLHGGANQEVLEMLASISEDGGDVDKYINRAKDKDDPFRLMGFGHRVYKNFDPRANVIRTTAEEVLNRLGVDDPLLDVAVQLQKRALEDDYFVERKLFPNVDFFSGIIYRALGFPVDMFTTLFALGRLPGWLSQFKEMKTDSSNRIFRPRQIYTGEPKRAWLPMEER
ncbi:MAG: citrate synthase [Acidimicrobiia bacterium]|nr:citrate synthase [Acidimicrobiia bacterium]